MPIHDWTRVDESLFHSFQLGWIVELSRRLNQGVLPSSHFAMTETLEFRPSHGFCVLPEPDVARPSQKPCPEQLRSVSEMPPGARVIVRREQIEYANRAVTVRDADTHEVVAAILIVTQGE